MKGLLHHVEIYVSDLQKTREFWGWFLSELGYKKREEWNGGFNYILENTYIVFVQAKKKYLDAHYHRCQVGLNHLAFHAESREMVDAMTEKLRKRGRKILYEDKHPFAGGEHNYAVFFEDPDRIKVELVAPE